MTSRNRFGLAAFKQLLERVKDKHLVEILRELKYERDITQRSWERDYHAEGYYRWITRLMFFLQNGVRPAGITNKEIEYYKELCTHLVARKVFKPTVLDELDKWSVDEA